MLILPTYIHTRWVSTKSRALEDIEILLEGNEENPEVLVCIPHKKPTYEKITNTVYIGVYVYCFFVFVL